MRNQMFGPWRFRRAAGAADDTTPVVHALDVISGFTSGGDAVTITGLNFRSSTSGAPPVVMFGSVAATSVVVVDQFTLTCVTPAYGTVGVVTITVTCGSQVGALVDAFTYFTTVVSNVSPKSGTTLGATRVLLSGLNFVTGSTITVDGFFARSVAFVDTEHYSFMTPAHVAGVGDIVITDPAGRVTTVRNGFQWTTLGRGGDVRRSPGVSIRESLGHSPNTATFVIDGASALPTPGEVVEIVDSKDSNRLLFSGHATTISESYEGRPDQLAFQVNAVDYTAKLNRKLPIGAYVDVSATEVVRDLVTRFAPGFTTAHVQTGLITITISFDGSKDFTTCLSEVCAMARAKWKVDYVKDIHVFTALATIAKPVVPPVPVYQHYVLPPALTAYMTVAAVNVNPGFTYPPGYYIFRHTFFWADGAESSLQSCSDAVYGDGNGQFDFENVPTGADRTYPAVYAYLFIQKQSNFQDGDTVTLGSRTYTFQDTLTDVDGNIHIGANLNETLDRLMFATQNSGGVSGTDYAASMTANLDVYCWPWDTNTRLCKAVTAGAAGNSIAVSDVVTADDIIWFGEGTIEYTTLQMGADAGTILCTGRRIYCHWLGDGGQWLIRPQLFCQVNDNVTTEFVTLFGQTGSGDALAVPIASTVNAPYVAFTASIPGPTAAPYVTAVLAEQGIGRGWMNFRTAFLYRDGSYSYTSVPSVSVGTETNSSLPISGFELSNIETGPVLGAVDVIARLVWVCTGKLVGTEEQLYAEPTWKFADIAAGLLVVPGNTTTTLSASWPLSMIGQGNAPYILDPPVTPAADLENVDAVGDITDDNTDLLHADSGSQPFTVTRDVSQLRNRIFVIGASTTVAVDCPDGNPTTARVVTTARTGPPPGSIPGSRGLSIRDSTPTVPKFDPRYIQLGKTKFMPATGGSVQLINSKSLKVTRWESKGVYEAVPSQNSGVADLVVGHDVILDCPEDTVPEGSTVSRFFQYDDVESQEAMKLAEPGTDGVYEYMIVDKSLVTDEQLRARAEAEAELYAWPIVTVRYATRDKKTVCGKTVHVDMTSPSCYGDFLIQDVSIDQIHDESDQLSPRYTVTASSMRMSLEDLLLALTKPALADVPHVEEQVQIFSVRENLVLYPNYLEITGSGFRKGMKVFFDGVESEDVILED